MRLEFENVKMATKAENYEELDRNGDELALIKAALASTSIIINGTPFRPESPVQGEELADILNAALLREGQKARFEFDDNSYLEVTIVSKRRGGSKTAWIESGIR